MLSSIHLFDCQSILMLICITLILFASGYIRIGSNVWARAVNGDYYRGVVTALTDKVHIKFEDGETIVHERFVDCFYWNILLKFP